MLLAVSLVFAFAIIVALRLLPVALLTLFLGA